MAHEIHVHDSPADSQKLLLLSLISSNPTWQPRLQVGDTNRVKKRWDLGEWYPSPNPTPQKLLIYSILLFKFTVLVSNFEIVLHMGSTLLPLVVV